ncbi:MAG: heme-binding protein [Hyphomicrobiaceae bacterium]
MLNIKRLSSEDAQIMLRAAEKKATEVGVPQVIAVTDESGNLIAFSRMDGGKVSSIRIAIDKAFTAAAAKNPTEHYNKLCVPGQPTFGIHVTNEGHFCVIGGGLPVIVDGQVVGGIGVSSGTPAQDIAVAQAGIDAVMATLKG